MSQYSNHVLPDQEAVEWSEEQVDLLCHSRPGLCCPQCETAAPATQPAKPANRPTWTPSKIAWWLRTTPQQVEKAIVALDATGKLCGLDTRDGGYYADRVARGVGLMSWQVTKAREICMRYLDKLAQIANQE